MMRGRLGKVNEPYQYPGLVTSRLLSKYMYMQGTGHNYGITSFCVSLVVDTNCLC